MKKRIGGIRKVSDIPANAPQVAESISIITKTPREENSGFIFWEMCRTYDFYLLRLMMRHSTSTVPEFWDSLRDLFEESGQIYRVLSEELEFDVSNTSEEQFLLRANSGATHLLSSVMRRDLTSLLEKHMNPIIQSVNHITDEINLDQDASNFSESTSTISELLRLHCTRFLTLGTDIPKEIKYIFARLRTAVEKKFAGSGTRAIAIIIFHRLITPALISPANYNSCLITPTENAKKVLMTLAKIYQSFIQQGQEPLKKTMAVFNQYVESMYDPMNKFLDSISVETKEPDMHKSPILSRQILDNACEKCRAVVCSATQQVLGNLVTKSLEDGKQIVLEHFLALMCEDWSNKEALKELQQPKSLALFNDEIDRSYNEVTEGFEKTVMMRIKKINELSDEIFYLRSIIEECCNRNGTDFEKVIEEYQPYTPLPPPVYTEERCGKGILELDEYSLRDVASKISYMGSNPNSTASNSAIEGSMGKSDATGSEQLAE
ncbi:hypothetical protein EIN_390450 [Entamoeba invadens IP1]|uniref:Ras-GAP domain-containing protein n=1 Tax=Entamoeba invadens IP1 TaxID=370355 RepID=A0A0A1U545_ENTIV|nr:hypothetical protein EIN_390450 [Entamoeba invadens IP1]ELP89430.1 hypothetical protein EIN_390450 [Entamoeba invadens IP1]|eukprot:XP_004256201.1 hypothetical protein EIN_390450 [Entamoeba invadens IP1]